MPTPLKEIVAHRAQMLRETLRDTPEQVVVAMDGTLIRQALAQTSIDLKTAEGAKAFITSLQLNSRSLSKSTPDDVPKLEKLGMRRTENVIIVKGPQPHRSTCWVREGYSGHRKAYKDFIKKIYGSVDFSGFRDLEVDHLAARGQKRMGGKFIRIEAIDKSVNRSHGAGPEKKMAGQKKRSARDKDGLTLLQVLKLYNLSPPRSPKDSARMALIEKTLKADGWNAAEVKAGIETLLQLYERKMD